MPHERAVDRAVVGGGVGRASVWRRAAPGLPPLLLAQLVLVEPLPPPRRLRRDDVRVKVGPAADVVDAGVGTGANGRLAAPTEEQQVVRRALPQEGLRPWE